MHPAPPRLPTAGKLAVLALALALLLFGALSADLLWQGPITRTDVALSTWFHARMHPALTRVFLVLTHMHSILGISVMALAAAGVLAWKKQGRWLSALVLCVPGGVALNALVKQAFQRARPEFDNPVLTLATYSFPSGHAAGATVWWGFLLVLWFAWQPRPAARMAGAAVAITMVLLAALSRVYLGVHYPSDVLAAIAEGTAWLALCFLALGRTTSSR